MPVNAQELRIGNLIQTPEGLAKVQTIANMKLGGFLLEKGGTMAMKYASCQPIELTEEWLDRFDFINDNETWWNHYVRVNATGDGGFYFSAMSDGISDLSYVHQLQNLAYAINQTELLCSL